MSGEKKKFNKAEYDLEYEQKNCYRFGIKFNNKSDSEVIKQLKDVPNKTDYIRQLILADIQKTKQSSKL